MKRIIFLLMIPLLFSSPAIFGQDGNPQVTYSNLALQFSAHNFNGDAGTGLFSSVASPNGYGSFVDNPASVGLIKEDYFNFSLLNNRVEYDNSYLNNSMVAEDISTKLGNMGFIYNIPTEQGSFVLGGGYNRLVNQNGINRIGGRNTESTITDGFKDPGSDYYDIAFNAYAIDWGDVDSTYLESIFRIGFENFPGITQEAEISYQTNIGEYSFFFGTEFQKDLFVGISGGLTSGSYTYRRDFLELDDRGDYDFNFIPSTETEEGTDIDNILTHDEIDADILGFALRAGAIYKILPNLNVGLSYLLPSTMVIRENYYSFIRTELDDGSTPFESDFASDEPYEYRIKKPGQFNVGISAVDIGKLDISASAEFIDYSNLSLDLITGNNLSFNDEVAIREQQDELDDFMSDSYKLVKNFKASAGYKVIEQVKVKAGYAFLEGKSKIFEADRNIISAGLSANITKGIVLDVNGQYSFWDDRSVAYSYFDFDGDVIREETITQQVTNIKIMAGVKFLF